MPDFNFLEDLQNRFKAMGRDMRAICKKMEKINEICKKVLKNIT